jgi:hypothetical protein
LDADDGSIMVRRAHGRAVGMLSLEEARMKRLHRFCTDCGRLMTELVELCGAETVATIAVGRAEIAGMLGELRGGL